MSPSRKIYSWDGAGVNEDILLFPLNPRHSPSASKTTGPIASAAGLWARFPESNVSSRFAIDISQRSRREKPVPISGPGLLTYMRSAGGAITQCAVFNSGVGGSGCAHGAE